LCSRRLRSTLSGAASPGGVYRAVPAGPARLGAALRQPRRPTSDDAVSAIPDTRGTAARPVPGAPRPAPAARAR
jgi:hypothetical protein